MLTRWSRHFRRPTPSRALTLLGVGTFLLGGCGPRERKTTDESTAASDAARAAAELAQDLPHAASIRFQEVKGTGLSRESWEVEILQADRDIWLIGSTRRAGRSIPVKEPMTIQEYHEFWKSMSDLSLQTLALHEDSSKADTGWKKTLTVDVVSSSQERVQSRHTWTRPLVGAESIDRLEADLAERLHAATNREAKRVQSEEDSIAATPVVAASDSALQSLVDDSLYVGSLKSE